MFSQALEIGLTSSMFLVVGEYSFSERQVKDALKTLKQATKVYEICLKLCVGASVFDSLLFLD